jgi:hypothetical protein
MIVDELHGFTFSRVRDRYAVREAVYSRHRLLGSAEPCPIARRSSKTGIIV